MTIVTRGGNQVNEFIDITTKFLKFNKTQKKYIKILPSLCREIEMLTKTKKRLKLIEEQNPDPREWAEHFDGYILRRWEDVLDEEQDDIQDVFKTLTNFLVGDTMRFINRNIIQSLTPIFFLGTESKTFIFEHKSEADLMDIFFSNP